MTVSSLGPVALLHLLLMTHLIRAWAGPALGGCQLLGGPGSAEDVVDTGGGDVLPGFL